MIINFDISAAIERLREKVNSPTHYSTARSRDSQRLRLNRLVAGVCARCGQKPYADGHGFCQGCLDGQKMRNRMRRKVIRIHARERVKERERRRQIKLDVLAHYGNKCACCGETEEVFLSMDHKNNDGAAHRKAVFNGPNSVFRGGTHIYMWIKRNKYPDSFQILCHNCNHGKHLNGGVCPHQMKPQLIFSAC